MGRVLGSDETRPLLVSAGGKAHPANVLAKKAPPARTHRPEGRNGHTQPNAAGGAPRPPHSPLFKEGTATEVDTRQADYSPFLEKPEPAEPPAGKSQADGRKSEE